MANPATTSLGNLPRWDLSDLYPAPDSVEFASDLARAESDAIEFASRFKGKLDSLPGDGLAGAVQTFEALQDRLGRIASFASLVYAGDMSDPAVGAFYQNTTERLNEIETKLLFFALELNEIDDDTLEDLFGQSGALSHYRPWFRDIRAFRPHQLSDDLERLLHEKDVAGRASWTRLFDETMAGLRFPVGGEMLTSEQALHRMSDRDPDRRRESACALGEVFGANARLFALITNTLAKDKEIEDRWRRYVDPAASRHLSNHVEPEVVDALVAAVTAAYPRLSHRYYALKARWLGQDTLAFWDRNAPVPDADDRLIPWDEARDIVLDAYASFSDELATEGRRFFDNPWIDAPTRPGKAPGAFAHPTVPSAHPYLLLNYQGKQRDVMTLAHELGHGVHQVLAAGRGALLAPTPLTLAETASVFGEQLTFRALLDREVDARRRRAMLAGKVEDMLNTVVRQIAFYQFERQVHEERRRGEISAERLGEIWLGVQRESLGPTFRFDPEYRFFWCYIPHFIHSPFYVYAYAFGDCLVNSMYAVYLDAHHGFQDKYLDMLRAGGTLGHRDLLAPFGLNALDPTFWKRGLDVISGFIDELEAE
jgi:oligoendopeptidase F